MKRSRFRSARLQAQGTLTLEELAESINRLVSGQEALTERLAALEAEAAWPSPRRR